MPSFFLPSSFSRPARRRLLAKLDGQLRPVGDHSKAAKLPFKSVSGRALAAVDGDQVNLRLFLVAAVGEKGEGLAVGRPARLAVVHLPWVNRRDRPLPASTSHKLVYFFSVCAPRAGRYRLTRARRARSVVGGRRQSDEIVGRGQPEGIESACSDMGNARKVNWAKDTTFERECRNENRDERRLPKITFYLRSLPRFDTRLSGLTRIMVMQSVTVLDRLIAPRSGCDVSRTPQPTGVHPSAMNRGHGDPALCPLTARPTGATTIICRKTNTLPPPPALAQRTGAHVLYAFAQLEAIRIAPGIRLQDGAAAYSGHRDIRFVVDIHGMSNRHQVRHRRRQ